MRLARKLLGVAALVGSAGTAVAQPPAVWPAPDTPNRLVFPAPPWITHAPRGGIPGAPPMPAVPVVNEVRFVAPGTARTPLPEIPMAPPHVVPAAAVAPQATPAPQVTVTRSPAATPAPRPDMWMRGAAVPKR